MSKWMLPLLVLVVLWSCGTSKKIAEPAKKFKEPSTGVLDSVVEIQPTVDHVKMPLDTVNIKTVCGFPLINVRAADNTIYNDWNILLQRYVDSKGVVDYKGFKKEIGKLDQVITAWGDHLPIVSASIAEQKAYWMNVYNAATVLLIVKHYPLKSIKDIQKPWHQRFFKLGKKWYNLDEVEHQILRKMGDARIHFGINCASISCPKLSNVAFAPSNVDDHLEVLTRMFVNDKQKNHLNEDKIVISKIFQWFAKDFKKDGGIIPFLNRYSEIKIEPKARKQFLKYNWGLNE